jgi:hypothetical protein
VSSLILFPLFATSVVDTAVNLLPVSLIPVAICYRYQHHQWQNLPPVLLTPVVNLPLMIPVVHLDLQKSPGIFEIFEIIRNDSIILFSVAWGKMIR